ncbi:MAG: hypothetical protein KF900_08685 [Bacteroidetes bacterium]|nr:hypothetical protein [Bacteroidota bacterium]
MKPEEVNPSNFEVEKIIYDDDEFSIAYGQWHKAEQGSRHLAVRWNGEGEEKGFPTSFGRPVWCLISSDLTDIFLTALLSSPNSNKKNIISIFNKEEQ